MWESFELSSQFHYHSTTTKMMTWTAKCLYKNKNVKTFLIIPSTEKIRGAKARNHMFRSKIFNHLTSNNNNKKKNIFEKKTTVYTRTTVM